MAGIQDIHHFYMIFFGVCCLKLQTSEHLCEKSVSSASLNGFKITTDR